VEDLFTSRETNEGSPCGGFSKSHVTIKRLSIGGSTKSRDHAEPIGAEHRPSAADQDQQQGQPFFFLSLPDTKIFQKWKYTHLWNLLFRILSV
jgi:hypothetical protein